VLSQLKANGPAIKNSKCCWAIGDCDQKSSSVTSRVPTHSRKERSMAWFLQVRVQVLWGIWVSQYKLQCEQVLSQVTQTF